MSEKGNAHIEKPQSACSFLESLKEAKNPVNSVEVDRALYACKMNMVVLTNNKFTLFCSKREFQKIAERNHQAGKMHDDLQSYNYSRKNSSSK